MEPWVKHTAGSVLFFFLQTIPAARCANGVYLQVSVSAFSLSSSQQVNNKLYLNVAALSDSNIISKSKSRF